MSPALKKRIQLVLVFAILVAGGRASYVFYTRHQGKTADQKKPAPPLNADYYVIPKKLYPFDLKSAKQLTRQPIWVREGYRYTYYSYDRSGHHADFSHDAGLLLPIERLDIKDVVTDVSPAAADQRQVLAIFEKDGKSYAVPIGTLRDGNYQIYSDEMFFIQDPHDLYKHWTQDSWDAIEKHEVKTGMDEFQVAFAVGMGVPEPGSDPAVKTVNYPNGGRPVSVTYRNGAAAEINSGGK